MGYFIKMSYISDVIKWYKVLRIEGYSRFLSFTSAMHNAKYFYGNGKKK